MKEAAMFLVLGAWMSVVGSTMMAGLIAHYGVPVTEIGVFILAVVFVMLGLILLGMGVARC